MDKIKILIDYSLFLEATGICAKLEPRGLIKGPEVKAIKSICQYSNWTEGEPT